MIFKMIFRLCTCIVIRDALEYSMDVRQDDNHDLYGSETITAPNQQNHNNIRDNSVCV